MFRPDRPSMGARVAWTVTLVLVFGIATLALVAWWRVSDRLRADLDRSLLREAEAYSASIARAGGSDLRDATRAYLRARSRAFSSNYPVLLVRFPDGGVISNTDLPLEDAAANRAALAGRGSRAFLDLTFRDVGYRAAAVPVTSSDGTVLAVFEAALPTAPTRDLGTQVLLTLLGVGAAVAAVGALVAVLAARRALRPLRVAADTASRVTQSSLAQRVEYDGPDDEVGRMVAALNAMLGRLEDSFREQRRFIADASHELRTPLAVVSGHVELLRDTEPPPRERAEELTLIADEVARMGRLVDDLLALARLDAASAPRRQALEVGTMLAEAAARGRGLGERSITVDAGDGLWVAGDPDQLMQALLNLVGNAVAHTAEGGSIVLRAAGEPDWVSVSVEDDGPGIPERDLARIFDRFYRAPGPRPGEGGGSGLGLAITRRLVELHGGSIAASNRPGGGASLTVRLPRVEAPR